MAAASRTDRRRPATPLARAVARDLGVDLDAVSGSGRGGRIMRADVEALAAGPSPPPADAVPQLFLTVRVDAEALAGFRAELNRQLTAGGDDLEVGLDDLVVKASAALLRDSPDLNSSFGGDRLIRHRRVHVGIAVAPEGGPVVPVIRDADRKRLTQVAREASDLIGRARTGRLAASEVGGATFTVSSLGGFGVRQFMAVLNPPEAAVLAVGAAEPEPVATDDGGVEVHRVLRLTLSIDHRVVDGATGARFLGRLRDLLEQPLRIVA
jgi:pyruvate dehydrogenase E2 component (dihydrolipoamide acetyltransferase)